MLSIKFNSRSRLLSSSHQPQGPLPNTANIFCFPDSLCSPSCFLGPQDALSGALVSGARRRCKCYIENETLCCLFISCPPEEALLSLVTRFFISSYFVNCLLPSVHFPNTLVKLSPAGRLPLFVPEWEDSKKGV